MSDQDKEWWKKILLYIEKEILGYDNNQHMQKAAVLRVRGLESGKVMANNKISDNGSYPLEVVYGAVVVSKPKFFEAKRGKKFDSEDGELAYFCAIVRSQLNNVYSAWKAKQHSAAVASAVQAEDKHQGASYKPKTRKTLANVSGSFW